jgi:hypothetical protein
MQSILDAARVGRAGLAVALSRARAAASFNRQKFGDPSDS